MITAKTDNGKLIISLTGTIDSANAPAVETELQGICSANPCESVELDCDQLEYCTSADLRVILRLKQKMDATVLTNVHTELYNIFDMTGFTEMMEVHKAYRVISVDGCEVIGQGANGKVYRINPDTIVKVYLNPDALPEIHRERELARLAFVAGVPTAIPYDVVRIEGGGFGSVFELLNATSYAKLIIRGEKTPDEIADMSIRLLKLIHSKEVRSNILPDMKKVALNWAMFLKDYLPPEEHEKLIAMISAVPEDAHLMHGDYHVKNVMLQNNESLLIDMDTLCHGHPIFELASMYNAYVGFGLVNHEHTPKFLGIPYETCFRFWRKSLALYLGTEDENRIDEVEAKAKIVGLTRLMRREIRRNGLNREDGRKMIEICRANLSELLPKVDSLVF
ncbi:MAG: phosphotransferase [Oscillospiraceae bacterium]|nr:phosphotransferase [Oscillospiraceae bacterium]